MAHWGDPEIGAQFSHVLTRYFRGDLTLLPEIAARHDVTHGTRTRVFVTQERLLDEIRGKNEEIEQKTLEIESKDLELQDKNAELMEKDLELHQKYLEIRELTLEHERVVATMQHELTALRQSHMQVIDTERRAMHGPSDPFWMATLAARSAEAAEDRADFLGLPDMNANAEAPFFDDDDRRVRINARLRGMTRMDNFLMHVEVLVLFYKLSVMLKYTKLSVPDLKNAVMQIMEIEEGDVAELGTIHVRNHISLRNFMCQVEKRRSGTEYSTQMPLEHAYVYTKNANRWIRQHFESTNLPNPISLQRQLDEALGTTLTATFRLHPVPASPWAGGRGMRQRLMDAYIVKTITYVAMECD
jgi:hypothetical protein